MKLYTLYFGKSKKKMHPIMTDSYDKCLKYQKARQNVKGWHEIKEGGDKVWRQKTCTIVSNRPYSVNRVGEARPGYIGKFGFTEHT
jgi:hypothetical protein